MQLRTREHLSAGLRSGTAMIDESNRTRNGGRFELVCPFRPTGDQPRAIESLSHGLQAGVPHQCLLGITGSTIAAGATGADGTASACAGSIGAGRASASAADGAIDTTPPQFLQRALFGRKLTGMR